MSLAPLKIPSYICDVGLYDGADTSYFLAMASRVVSIEANPVLIERAKLQFAEEINAGRLELTHAAISDKEGVVDLAISGDDLGASSLFRGRITDRNPVGACTVEAITMQSIFDRFGIPYYLKVDIEGADRFAVLALKADQKPPFLSFEVGHDFEELLSHCVKVGYRRFKLINQKTFRAIDRERIWRERLLRGVIRRMGYEEPRAVRFKNRWFQTGHSSGPAPWQSDGRWHTHDDILTSWHARHGRYWYDLHAWEGDWSSTDMKIASAV